MAVTTKWMLSRSCRSRLITASLPTPLGPLMTRIKGLGFGRIGSELNGEPSEASRALYSSALSAVSVEGIRTESVILWFEEMSRWGLEFGVWRVNLCGFEGNIAYGFRSLVWGREGLR